MKTKRAYRRTDIELIRASKRYTSRGSLQKKDPALYMALYTRGLLDKTGIKSRHKHRYTKSVAMFAKIVGEAIQFESVHEAHQKSRTLYDAQQRLGYDLGEIIENRNDPVKLGQIIIDAYNRRLLKK